MEEQNNKYFTIWYGVYHQKNHVLTFSSAGHPHAILFSGDDLDNKKLQTLTSGGLAIGMMPGIEFKDLSTALTQALQVMPVTLNVLGSKERSAI